MRLKSHPEIVWWCYLQEDSGSVKFRTQSWRGRASDDLGFYFFSKFFPSPPFWISTSVLETSNHKTLKVKTVFLDSGKIQPAFDLGSRLPSKAALTHSRLQGYNFFFALCNFCYIYSKLDTLALEALEGFFFPFYNFGRHIRIWFNWEQWILFLKEQPGFLEFWTLIFPFLSFPVLLVSGQRFTFHQQTLCRQLSAKFLNSSSEWCHCSLFKETSLVSW